MATVVVADSHGVEAAAVPDPVNCVVDPVQTDNVPLIVGKALTVTVAVFEQPRSFVYVITLVPAATAVTKPVLFTVATVVVADSQGLEAAAVPDPVNCVVEPTQADKVPVMVGGTQNFGKLMADIA